MTSDDFYHRLVKLGYLAEGCLVSSITIEAYPQDLVKLRVEIVASGDLAEALA